MEKEPGGLQSTGASQSPSQTWPSPSAFSSLLLCLFTTRWRENLGYSCQRLGTSRESRGLELDNWKIPSKVIWPALPFYYTNEETEIQWKWLICQSHILPILLLLPSLSTFLSPLFLPCPLVCFSCLLLAPPITSSPEEEPRKGYSSRSDDQICFPEEHSDNCSVPLTSYHSFIHWFCSSKKQLSNAYFLLCTVLGTGNN